MFSSAVLCGKRLKFWNTMPISARCRAMLFSLSSTKRPLTSRYPMRCPFTRMRPSWIFSRWFTHRRNVDFPDPDGPRTTTASRRFTVSEIPFRTWSLPNHLWTPTASTTVSSEVRPPTSAPPNRVTRPP